MFKKQVISVLLMMVLVLSVAPMTAEATATGVNNGIEYFVNYAEPATSEYEGYISVLLINNSTGEKVVNTFFWYSCANSNGVQAPCYMCLNISSGSINFNPGGSGATTGAFYSLSQWNETGRCGNVLYSSSTAFTWDFNRWEWSVIGYKYAGNVGNVVVSGVDNESNLFSVYFSEDGSAMLLMDIISLLHTMQNTDSSILSTVSSILNSVDGVENQLSSVISYLQSVDSKLSSISSQLQNIYNKADEILSEQKETNNWLEKIFNFLEEKDEKDKEAATQQGNQSTTDIDNVIQDDSAGFVDSLGGLTSSMSYTGTACSWTFPTIKLPAISGVMDEVTLVESQEIDFSYWVHSIPSRILLLIQSVCTVALIVFCFKELYGAVSYALTLKGGGN